MLEQLLARQKELTEQREALMAQILQAQHNVSAFNGAIEENGHWIEYLQQGGGSDVAPKVETIEGMGQRG